VEIVGQRRCRRWRLRYRRDLHAIDALEALADTGLATSAVKGSVWALFLSGGRLVGHDPAVPELALALATPSRLASTGAVSDTVPPSVFKRMQAKFPTAAIAVLEFTGTWDELVPGSARLTHFVTPRDLGTSANQGSGRRHRRL
jgi:hypothetical protein